MVAAAKGLATLVLSKLRSLESYLDKPHDLHERDGLGKLQMICF